MAQKYFIYKTSGGLNHMLYQINNAVHLSIQTNRYLIIDCHSREFGEDFDKYFHIPDFNYSTNYNSLYEDPNLDKNTFIPYISESVAYRDTHLYYLKNLKVIKNKNEILSDRNPILYFTYFNGENYKNDWRIKVNQNIIENISKNPIQEKYIGFHYRNTDTKNDLSKFINPILKLANKTKILYLATDDYTAYERLSKFLEGKMEIIQYTKPYNGGGKPIHRINPDKNEVIINSLIDMYHLIKATYFIPSKSSFSRRVSELRTKDNFFNTEKI